MNLIDNNKINNDYKDNKNMNLNPIISIKQSIIAEKKKKQIKALFNSLEDNLYINNEYDNMNQSNLNENNIKEI